MQMLMGWLACVCERVSIGKERIGGGMRGCTVYGIMKRDDCFMRGGECSTSG